MPKFDEKKFIPFLIFLHLAAALPLAYFVNIWADEASTLYTTQNGFPYALQNAFSIEKQAPLYFWVLSLWRGLDDSVFFARLFSIIISALAIVFFFRLARKFFDKNAAVFATAFFALHPYLFWASLEIRLYSSVILFSILILYLFTENFLNSRDVKPQIDKEILFIFVSIVALYTNYYLGFLLVGCFVALPVLRKWTEAKKYFLNMLVVGLFFLPLLWAMKAQFAVNSSDFQTEKSLFEGLRLIWHHFLTFVLPTEIFPPQTISLISFFRLWLVRLAILTAIVLLIKTRKIFDEKILAFGAISATIVFFLLAAYFLLGGRYIAIRHAAVLFVPVIFLVSIVLKEILPQKINDKFFSKFNYLISFSFIVLIALFFAYSIYTLYPNLTKRGDWARIAAFIEAHEKPDQPIIIFPNYDALALPVYYKGANKILPDENFFAWSAEAEPGTSESTKKQMEFIISEIPSDAKEIWLLTDESCEITERCRPLENFVEANYNIVESKMFYLEKLRLLRKK
ncbi:hypothetical protein BH20ACI4_BH20ACI4_11760 [soil metagenome]